MNLKKLWVPYEQSLIRGPCGGGALGLKVPVMAANLTRTLATGMDGSCWFFSSSFKLDLPL